MAGRVRVAQPVPLLQLPLPARPRQRRPGGDQGAICLLVVLRYLTDVLCVVRDVQPAHGQLIDVETQEGDVVLLGTDGLCVSAGDWS